MLDAENFGQNESAQPSKRAETCWRNTKRTNSETRLSWSKNCLMFW